MSAPGPADLVIGPQAGPQTAFMSSPADLVIYGGSAGGGKTYSLLLEPLRHINVPKFNAVIFRRTYPEIKNAGGLWDNSQELYPVLGGRPRESQFDWTFKTKGIPSTVRMAHLQHEKDKYGWQGSQVCLLCFDELTHFTMSQFFYLLSRNRSTCGVTPYIRTTCNPDPDSWVRRLIEWWIDEETGLPIMERSGVVRFFARAGNDLEFADTREELEARGLIAKSITFIPASVYDNKALLDVNPDYLGNLQALVHHERERLLHGNWNARPRAGDYFRREWFTVVDALPTEIEAQVRAWDRAGTEPSESSPDPDWTVGLRLTEAAGIWYVVDVSRGRYRPDGVQRTLKATASQDGAEVPIVLEKDPGQAGGADVDTLIKALAGYDVKTSTPTKSKEIRARPVAAQAEAGNIRVLRGKWNAAFFDELEAFPGDGHDDQVDALSCAFNWLTLARRTPGIRFL